MNYILRCVFLSVVYLFLCGYVVAEEVDSKQHDIETVTVITSASQPVVKQSAPVQSISKEKIDILGLDNLSDAVQTFSGVNIVDYGGLGGMKTVSVRSLGATHTAVSYDGVIVSNAQGGQVDISNFTLDNIEEVSLTIGQGDEIFQSARNFESSGVLNIRSSAPRFVDQVVKVGVEMQVGSFGFYNPTVDIAAKLTDRWSMSVLADWMLSDGNYPFTLVNNTLVTDEIRTNSDVNTLRSEFNVYGNVGKGGGKIQIKGSYLDSERGLPGGVIYYNNDSNERLWDKSHFLQANYSNDFSDKWSISSYAKYNYAWNRYININELDTQYTQEEYYASGSVRYRPNGYWSFTLAQDIFENKLVTTFSDCPDPFRISYLTAFAGQYKSDRLTVTASLLGVLNHEWALNDTYSVAPDRKHISPALSLSYKIFDTENFRLRASVKDAYRVPTFNDLYYKSMGNTDLTPEKAMQYNVGLTYGGEFLSDILDYTTLSIDAYYNKVDDKIVAIPTMFVWKMMNYGEVEIQGVDVNLSTYFTPMDGIKFNIAGNYTYQHAVDVTDPSAKNYRDQIPYTARHSGNLMATCTTNWFDVGYTAIFVGERYCLAQNIAMNYIEGYTDQSINISRTFNIKSVSLRLRAEVLNLCDVNYDVIRYYPMPGRQYRFSVRFNY